MHVVYFACPGKPGAVTVRRYEQALSPLGDVQLVWIAKPGFSSVFVREAQRLRRNDRIVPELLRHYPASGRISTISLICFSAGYGFARELLRHPEDRAALDGLVLLDALHTGFDGDGTAADHQLTMFAEYARLAQAGAATFAMAHTDVPTPQPGQPNAFASTTQTAEELLRLTGGARGRFTVHSYDRFPPKLAKREHGAALVDWGPGLVQTQLVPHLQQQPTITPLWQRPELTVGERAVEWSLSEMANGVCEVPLGSNTGPRIEQYLAPSMRNGKRLGLRRGHWCAAGFCAAEAAALLPGEQLVLPYRCSGIELQRDAAERGLWVPKAAVLAGEATIRRGDGVVLRRGKPGGWQRHQARVTAEADGYGEYEAIGGNENDRWKLTGRSLHAENLLGFIRYPRAAPEPELDPERYAIWVAASDAVMRGEYGLDHALATLEDGTG